MKSFTIHSMYTTHTQVIPSLSLSYSHTHTACILHTHKPYPLFLSLTHTHTVFTKHCTKTCVVSFVIPSFLLCFKKVSKIHIFPTACFVHKMLKTIGRSDTSVSQTQRSTTVDPDHGLNWTKALFWAFSTFFQ